jgi:hypothetical protein
VISGNFLPYPPLAGGTFRNETCRRFAGSLPDCPLSGRDLQMLIGFSARATALLFATGVTSALLGSTASGIASGADADRHAKQWVGTWATSARPFVPASPWAFFGIYLGRGGRLGLKCLLLSYFRVGDYSGVEGC